MKTERLLQSQEVHSLLVEMLRSFAEYCEKYGLRYYLVGGTLLGAVRHQGFIPWDDDIDVGMPREDYGRFLSLVEKEPISDEYKIISAREGTLPLPFAEMIHINTRLERPTSAYLEEKSRQLYLFLDIFPQDGWPESIGEAKSLVRKAKWKRFLILQSRATIGAGTNLVRKISKIPFILWGRFLGTDRICMSLDRFAQNWKFDESKYVGAITYGIYGLGERCLREEVVDFKQVEFEGTRFCAPGCWDSYLRAIFGNYMDLPPVEKRVSHSLKVWLTEEK